MNETYDPARVARPQVAPIQRTSWSAIFAGTMIALAIMVILSTLGLAIGATTLDPGPGPEGSPSITSLGIGAGIWWLLTGLISLLAGGWATGRLAGSRHRTEGFLHGIVTWSLVMLVVAYASFTAIGAVISGAVGVIGSVASGASTVISKAGHSIAAAVPDPNAPDVAWQEVWSEAKLVLRQTGKPALQPDALAEQARAEANDLKQAAGESASDASSQELQGALSELYRTARTTASAADKEAAVNVLVARTSMSRQEARDAVDAWTNKFQRGWNQVEQAVGTSVDQVQETAKSAAGTLTDIAAAAAWWTLLFSVLTAVAATVGGMLGAPKHARLTAGDPTPARVS